MKIGKLKTQLNGKLFISILILSLIALSSFRVIDEYADNYTTESIQIAAISYATARGINALVSMLQTSNVQADVVLLTGSISIGELLDPLNDLIERFSSVLTVVLGSLAAQKALLLVSSHKFFLYLIAFFGVVSLLTIYFSEKKYFSLALKIFLVVIFMRFSLGVAVTLNGFTDKYFFLDQTKEYDKEVEIFKQQIVAQGEIPDEKRKRLLREYDQTEHLIKAIQNKINKDSEHIKPVSIELKKCSFIQKYRNSHCKELKGKVATYEEELDGQNASMELLVDQRNDILAKLKALDENADSTPADYIKKMKDWVSDFDLKDMEEKIKEVLNAFMSLIALYILKTIVFPLLFFYFFLSAIKWIWRMDSSRYLN